MSAAEDRIVADLVVAHASDAAEARALLDMLGLIDGRQETTCQPCRVAINAYLRGRAAGRRQSATGGRR